VTPLKIGAVKRNYLKVMAPGFDERTMWIFSLIVIKQWVFIGFEQVDIYMCVCVCVCVCVWVCVYI
jgi:hypothetical protein